MQIQTFKIFSDLADSSSFSRAAAANGVTQSAVSQQVRAIEDRYGVKLIERGRRNFSLTPEGRAFLDASREILKTLEGLSSRIQELKHVVAGELRVATIFSIGLHELPHCLKEFRHTFPLVDVRVEYRRSTEVYSAVLEGRADVGLVAYPGERRGLTSTTFWKDRLKVICCPTHRLADRKSIPLSALEGERFIAFEPDLPTRREIDRRFKESGIKVHMVLEFDNIETVKRAVEIENGVSIVPETAVADEVKSGSLAAISLEGAEMWRPLGALTRNSARVSPALKEFLARLETFGRSAEAAADNKTTKRKATKK